MRGSVIWIGWVFWGCSGASDQLTIQASSELEVAMVDYVDFLEKGVALEPAEAARCAVRGE